MKRFLYTALIIVLSIVEVTSLKAQDTTSTNPFSISCDMMSRYVWRGTEFGGKSPSIQPGIEANYKNFTIGAWGAYSTGGVHASQEMDLYMSANFYKDYFTVVVTDYYFPSDTANYNYLGYDSKTDHVLEAGLIFNGTNNIPISFSAYMNFYGNDAQRLGDDPGDTTTFNKNIGIQYSNYFEVAYNKSFNSMDLSAFVGFTFSKQAAANASTGFIGESGYYGNGAGIVNVGLTLSKGIKITDNYSLPITTSFIINPNSKKVFLIFGISF